MWKRIREYDRSGQRWVNLFVLETRLGDSGKTYRVAGIESCDWKGKEIKWRLHFGPMMYPLVFQYGESLAELKELAEKTLADFRKKRKQTQAFHLSNCNGTIFMGF